MCRPIWPTERCRCRCRTATKEDGSIVDADGQPASRVISRRLPRTAMGREIRPEGLTNLLLRLDSEAAPGVSARPNCPTPTGL